MFLKKERKIKREGNKLGIFRKKAPVSKKTKKTIEFYPSFVNETRVTLLAFL